MAEIVKLNDGEQAESRVRRAFRNFSERVMFCNRSHAIKAAPGTHQHAASKEAKKEVLARDALRRRHNARAQHA